MLSVLLKKQLTEIFRNYFYNPKTNKARSKAAVAAYIVLFAVLMVVILGGMFTVLSAALCTPLTAAGLDWLYFALMALLATLLGAFGSVFNTYSGLYLAKDNDLLLSMPIPVNTLMASRLLGVYLMGLMYSGVVMLPAVIVYWVATPAPAAAVIGGVLLVFLLSVFVLALSCALGWLVAKISQKLKNKSFITVVLSLAFFGAYYFFYFKAEDLLQELLRSAAVYGARIKGAAYPLYLLGRVGTGDITAMLTVSAVILALFAALWVLLRRSFIRIATATGQSAKRAYRERAAVRRSVSSALLSKELCRFTASPNYMLNCGMGVLLMPLAGFTLLWKGPDIRAALGAALGAEAGAYLSVMLTAALCMLAAMNDMAAPSVSLEGKSLWLLQSLPVTPWQVLRAKLRFQLLLTAIPVLVRGHRAAHGGGGDSTDGGTDPAVRGVFSPAGTDAGPEDAPPPLDQRAGAHQAERLRGHHPSGRLGLRAGAAVRLPAGGAASGRGGVHGHLCRADTAGLCVAVPLAEKEGRRGVRSPVNAKKDAFARAKASFRISYRWSRAWRQMASKLVWLMSCSILQASASAVSRSTPSAIRKRVSVWCRSSMLEAMDIPCSVRVMSPSLSMVMYPFSRSRLVAYVTLGFVTPSFSAMSMERTYPCSFCIISMASR